MPRQYVQRFLKYGTVLLVAQISLWGPQLKCLWAADIARRKIPGTKPVKIVTTLFTRSPLKTGGLTADLLTAINA